MVNGLISAKMNYFRTLDGDPLVVDRALRTNELYCDRLFELYGALTDLEEREEIELEIDHLIGQARALRFIRLNYEGGEYGN